MSERDCPICGRTYDQEFSERIIDDHQKETWHHWEHGEFCQRLQGRVTRNKAPKDKLTAGLPAEPVPVPAGAPGSAVPEAGAAPKNSGIDPKAIAAKPVSRPPGVKPKGK